MKVKRRLKLIGKENGEHGGDKRIEFEREQRRKGRKEYKGEKRIKIKRKKGG